MLYIHIGFRKTGSTTIQAFLAGNAGPLAAASVLYPRAGLAGRAHFNLLNDLRGRDFIPERGGVDEVAKLMSENPDKHVLLSSEGFHNAKPRVIRTLAERLPHPQVRVIAYIRHLSSLIVSAYMQTAKTGHFTRDFDEFFAHRAGSEASEYGQQVFGQLSHWADVYGWPALRVRTLDADNLVGGDLLTDFLAAIDVSWDRLPDYSVESTERRNVSPGWKTVELLRALNKGVGSLRQVKEREAYRSARRDTGHVRKRAEAIADEIGLNGERGDYLTSEQWELCDSAYAQVVAQLNAVLTGPPLPAAASSDFTPRTFLPEASRVAAEERAAFYERMAFALMADARAATVSSPTQEADERPRNFSRRAGRKRKGRPATEAREEAGALVEQASGED